MPADQRSKTIEVAASADENAAGNTAQGSSIRTEPAKVNRGRRAPAEGSGVVVGSGAGAGGGSGVDEDYDDDPVGGGGALKRTDDVAPPR